MYLFRKKVEYISGKLILMCVGWRNLSEVAEKSGASPEDIVEYLTRYVSEVDEIVNMFSGSMAHIEGEYILAAWPELEGDY
jgi:class 3 adenylate cyclase